MLRCAHEIQVVAGLTAEALHATTGREGWLKQVAPTPELRRWFGHDPRKRPEFKRRYFDELRANDDALAPLRGASRRKPVTLVYGARDTEHNAAVALREYLTSLR